MRGAVLTLGQCMKLSLLMGASILAIRAGIPVLLKQVRFTSDSRNESNHKVDFRMVEMEIRPAWSKSIDKHWFMFEGIYLGKTGYEKTARRAAITILAAMVMVFGPITATRYQIA